MGMEATYGSSEVALEGELGAIFAHGHQEALGCCLHRLHVGMGEQILVHSLGDLVHKKHVPAFELEVSLQRSQLCPGEVGDHL